MTPAWDDVAAAATAFSVPLTTRFRGVTSREGVLLCGPSGWGEFAPFAEYPPPVAARWLAAAIEAAWGTWPAPVRDEVPVNLIVPELDPVAAAAHVRACLDRDGTTTAKVKVSGSAPASDEGHPRTHRRGAASPLHPQGSLGADEDRVAAVRAALDHAGVPEGRIRIDVNGGWTLHEATTRLPVLDRAARGLEYVEQPCESLDDLAALRRASGVPVALDEGVRLAADGADADPAWRRAVREACDLVILKPTPMGGVARALAVAQRLRRPAVVSGAMDTSIGLAAGIAAAAALPQLDHACGLGTGSLLADDLTATTTRPEQGRLRPVRTVPDPDRLAAARERLGDQAAQQWVQRLHDAYDAYDAARTAGTSGTAGLLP